MTALDADTLRDLRNRAEAAKFNLEDGWTANNEAHRRWWIRGTWKSNGATASIATVAGAGMGSIAEHIAAADPATVLALLDAAEAVADKERRLNDALAIRVRVEVERDELSATVERIRALADEWDAEDDRDPYNELSAEHVVARLRAALAPPPGEPRRITYEQAKRLVEPGYTPPPDHALVKEPTRPADYTTHDDEDDER